MTFSRFIADTLRRTNQAEKSIAVPEWIGKDSVW